MKALESWKSTSQGMWATTHARLACMRGQGTTEYAIIVGVLVVIAIGAITLFAPAIQTLWDEIKDGINGLTS